MDGRRFALLFLFSISIFSSLSWATDIYTPEDFTKWASSKSGAAIFKADVSIDLGGKLFHIHWPGAGLINTLGKKVELKHGTLRFYDIKGIKITGIYMHDCIPDKDTSEDETDIRDCIAIVGDSDAEITQSTFSRGGDELINCRNEIDNPTKILVQNCLLIHHKPDIKRYTDADKVSSIIGNCQITFRNNVFFDVSRLVASTIAAKGSKPDSATDSAVNGKLSLFVLQNNVFDYPCREFWMELKSEPNTLQITNNWFSKPRTELISSDYFVPKLSPTNCLSANHVSSSKFSTGCKTTAPAWRTLKTKCGAPFFKLADLQNSEPLCGTTRRRRFYKK